jgi:predicted alpha/beta-hydrolase family hydrolase
MDTPFMTTVARELGERGIRVVRFEFPYMAARRTGGKRGAPDREAVLLATWRDVVTQIGGQLGGGARVFIGGKSMGGRMATLVADELRVRGVVCFGYPFHPPGQPAKVRTAHLETLATPMLVLQGERDPFGTREDVVGYRLSPRIRIEWIPDGDHSLKPRARAGVTERQNLTRAIEVASAFIDGNNIAVR